MARPNLATGAWLAALVAIAETVETEFATLLAQSYPSNAAALRGQPSRSGLIARLLARTIDHAALALSRRLDRDDPADHGQGHQTRTGSAARNCVSEQVRHAVARFPAVVLAKRALNGL